MAEQWNAGDKVKLTGAGWTRATRGAVVVLKRLIQDDMWAVEGQDYWVVNNPDDKWAAMQLATGGLVTNAALDFPRIGEVRTTSSTGGEKGIKPEAYALVPWDAMDEVARVYEFGAQKYADHNWRKGYEWSKSFSALCRHIFAFWKGEDRDPESGLSHLAHATFHTLGILSFWLDKERYGKFDDRYKGEA